MSLTKKELLKKLQEAVTAEEWEMLDAGSFSVSAFNLEVLKEMKYAEISRDEPLNEEQVSGLYYVLRNYLEKHLAEKTEAWKWIFLSGIYLTFLAERPMHPVELMGIREISGNGRMVYECPEKSAAENTPCRYCVCTRMSNYEIMKRQMQKAFLNYDQESMIQKFGLGSDEDHIYLEFLKRLYRVDRLSGRIEWSKQEFENWQEADYNEAMTLYDILCYSKTGCHPSGEFVPMGRLSALKGSSASHADKGFFQKEEKLFDHRDDRLAGACEELGGIKAGKGDVSYIIPVFDSMSLMLQFWNSDEEFPASLQIFCDKNILDYMHYETVWFMVTHLVKLLSEFIGQTEDS